MGYCRRTTMYVCLDVLNIVYLDPLIQTLGVVANLTVDSQVQFYAGLTFEPEKQQDTDDYIVPLDKLPGFVNSAEWNLGTLRTIPSDISNCNNLLSRYQFHSLRPSPGLPTSPS